MIPVEFQDRECLLTSVEMDLSVAEGGATDSLRGLAADDVQLNQTLILSRLR